MKWPKNKSPWILLKLWDLLEVSLTKTVQKFGQKNPSGSASSGLETVLIFYIETHWAFHMYQGYFTGISGYLGVFHGVLGVFYGVLGVFHGFSTLSQAIQYTDG